MSESKKTRDLCTELRKFNALVFSVAGGQFQRPGMPDRFIAHRRTSGFWVEFKDSNGRLTEAQRLCIADLKLHKCFAVIARYSNPGRIEDEDGTLLTPWDGTACGLLNVIERLLTNL